MQQSITYLGGNLQDRMVPNSWLDDVLDYLVAGMIISKSWF